LTKYSLIGSDLQKVISHSD